MAAYLNRNRAGLGVSMDIRQCLLDDAEHGLLGRHVRRLGTAADSAASREGRAAGRDPAHQ